tara:strand:+ start:120 stop:1055 length:936 start_codon:yes stop_codon:yes gene_type:complete
MFELKSLVEKSKDKIQYYKVPYPHFIIDDFLPDEMVDEVIDNAIAQFDDDTLVIHGNRKFIPNTSAVFQTLMEESSAWKILHRYLASQEFFNELKDNFYKNDTAFYKKMVGQHDILVKNLIKQKNSNFYQKLRSIRLRRVDQCSLKGIIAFKIFSILEAVKLKCRVVISEFVSQKKIAQMLFDLSLAGNGYKREIHRDSDNRVFVFILYLSELDDKGSGGDLRIYSSQNTDESTIMNTRPSKDEVRDVSSIKPQKNRLVVFLNSERSFHGVDKMEQYQTKRLFCYGSFTMLNKPLLKLRNSMKTEFSLHIL